MKEIENNGHFLKKENKGKRNQLEEGKGKAKVHARMISWRENRRER